ncbi:MAG: hypothetical protein AMK69_11060 [Nitrospira bacterium SG8_3]|nr:MAG: hypothetical protein AMK69_11060 [Nitrospira bacterium SG8_3]
MRAFDDYHEAYNCAVAMAKEFRIDYGVRKVKEFGKVRYLVYGLPIPENTFGQDLNAERVTKNHPFTDGSIDDYK